MSTDVYFLNDFQKSTITSKYKDLKISFEDEVDRTYVIIDHPKLSNIMDPVASSASWKCDNPQYDYSKQSYTFVKHSVEDIVERIEFCIEHWELY